MDSKLVFILLLVCTIQFVSTSPLVDHVIPTATVSHPALSAPLVSLGTPAAATLNAKTPATLSSATIPKNEVAGAIKTLGKQGATSSNTNTGNANEDLDGANTFILGVGVPVGGLYGGFGYPGYGYGGGLGYGLGLGR